MALRSNETQDPIIKVRKRRLRSEPMAHGGWKVAYADFVTAMMAFFLLMWLVSSTDKDQQEALSNYFNPYQSEDDSKEVEIETGIISIMDGGQMAGSDITARETSDNNQEYIPETPDDETDDIPNWEIVEIPREEYEDLLAAKQEAEDKSEGELDYRNVFGNMTTTPDDEGTSVRTPAFQELARSLESLKEEMNILEQYEDIIRIDEITSGLRIQFIDQDEFSMFESGRANLNTRARDMIERFGRVLKDIPNKIVITGHTDSTPFVSRRDYSNWELSSDRANSARRAVLDAGVVPSQIERVEGKAATEPLLPGNPESPENRRINFIILR